MSTNPLPTVGEKHYQRFAVTFPVLSQPVFSLGAVCVWPVDQREVYSPGLFTETSSPPQISFCPPTSEDSTEDSRRAENLQVTVLTSFIFSENMAAREKPDCVQLLSMKGALVLCLRP